MQKNNILSIQAKDIERLDEHQLPTLLRCLLASEAHITHQKGEKAEYYVPEQINVPDGGSDGSWNGPPIHGIVEKEKVFFQCKAETRTLQPGKFEQELAPWSPK